MHLKNMCQIILKSNKWGKSTVTVTLEIDKDGGVKVTKYDPTEFGTYSENGSVPAAEDKKVSE